jgi:uncharacterized protein YxeA
MKKIIFTIILVASLFAITGLAWAKDKTGNKNQVFISGSDIVMGKPIVTDNFEKTAKDKVVKNIPHSEHYMLKNLIIQ